MKIFISHSSKDAKIAKQLSKFLDSLSLKIDIFCSSISGHIRFGSDFEAEILRNLDGCDAFIPLLSDNFYKSKYCMIELGFAYSYLCRKYDHQEEYIFPIAIPPTRKAEALSGTPLQRLQVCSINFADDIKELANALCAKKCIDIDGILNRKVFEFIYEVNRLVFLNFDILRDAKPMICKGGVAGEDADYLRYSTLDKRAGYTVNFRAKPFKNSKAYPDFLSFVLKFVDVINLYDIVNIYPKSKLKVNVINYTNSINKINIEIKYGITHDILERKTYMLKDGDNHIIIPIKDIKCEALKDVSEICFVIVPSAYTEDEGMFLIKNIEVSTDESADT